MSDETMIRASKKTTSRLKKIGRKGETYDYIINRILDQQEEDDEIPDLDKLL